MAISGEERTRITVDLGDSQLYKAVRWAAIQRNTTAREIIVAAMREWLERMEETENHAAIEEVRGEETVPWEDVRARMRATRERPGGR